MQGSKGHVLEREVAAAFFDPKAAESARKQLADIGVDGTDVDTAPGSVATTDEGPIEHDVVLLVAFDGPEDRVRDVLERAGGRIVADRDVERE